MEQTIQQMQSMKLYDMANKFKEMISGTNYQDLSHADFISHLIGSEYIGRENRKKTRLLRQAQLKYQSHTEEIDYHSNRGLNKSVILELSTNRWVIHNQNILISGATGVGKSFISCALGQKCCENGITVYYLRASKLMDEIHQARGLGNYLDYLRKLSRFKVLILDDFGVSNWNKKDSSDFLDIIEDRYQTAPIIISSQLPFNDWYNIFGDDTIADAVCDRIFHNAYKIELKGDSMRKVTT
ncbi:MAG: IS21-like element helper ATPase IstB [Candidatus Omnitrophica bacterium]|nr:IS21-like element helper ATPase IstB [Candidatus Omnitrophota bacterium]